MVRKGLTRRRVGGEEGFRWRGVEVWRVEGFSDSVFAFAVTLLVVSLEVPRTFDELLAVMRGFFAFAICFALLLSVWHDHYKYFRRYGLRDTPTMWLNSVLLFLVLIYVYPLKFLFTLLTDQFLGFGDKTRVPGGGTAEMIEPSQIPLLMMIYGAGFVAVQLVFVLFYWRAYSLRGRAGARRARAVGDARGGAERPAKRTGRDRLRGHRHPRRRGDGLLGRLGLPVDSAATGDQQPRHGLAQEETLSLATRQRVRLPNAAARCPVLRAFFPAAWCGENWLS